MLAAFYDVLTRGADRRIIGPERRRLISACCGRVLEIGAGTGASFPDWVAAQRSGALRALVAVEPDPHMRRRAAARARRLGLAVDLTAGFAEALPFADASFDSVAAFLVLCTVADPARTLAEVCRVLRPGGTLAFVEHVRVTGPAARWQRRLRRVWSFCGAGCRLDRDTAAAIVAAGFTEVSYRSRPLPFPLYRLIAGTARRGGRAERDPPETALPEPEF